MQNTEHITMKAWDVFNGKNWLATAYYMPGMTKEEVLAQECNNYCAQVTVREVHDE